MPRRRIPPRGRAAACQSSTLAPCMKSLRVMGSRAASFVSYFRSKKVPSWYKLRQEVISWWMEEQ